MHAPHPRKQSLLNVNLSLINRARATGSINQPVYPNSQSNTFPPYPSPIQVPQDLYRSRNENWLPGPQENTIVFRTRCGLGIPVRDVLDKIDTEMLESNLPTDFQHSSIAIRLEWPGHKGPGFGRQIKTSTRAINPQPITRGKLAEEICKVLSMFINSENGLQPTTDGVWTVGPGNFVTVDNLVLYGITQVSTNAWQPILFIA